MARKESNIHYIYKTTCNVTGRWYIGMHSTSNLEDGYMGSGKILRYSIRKYGKDNHTKEILEYFNSRKELVLREVEIVNLELISDGLCMNLKEGGSGGGGFWSEEHKLKCQLAGNKTFVDKIKNNENFKNVITNTLKENNKKAHENGNCSYNNFKDKKHSNETKQLISEIKRGTGTGETNSQYGTCWITNGIENKKIKKEDFDSYQLDGWIKNNICQCGNIKSRNAINCKTCCDGLKRKFDRPNKEILSNEVKNSNYSAVGRKYGVSDNTIRKWLK